MEASTGTPGTPPVSPAGPTGRPFVEPDLRSRPSTPFDEPPSPFANMPDVQAQASTWIRENLTLSLIAGFALGVFIGAMMRD